MLHYAKLLFECSAQETVNFPAYRGGTFRGAFGYALKNIVCAFPRKFCTECFLMKQCLYSRIFESRADESKTFIDENNPVPRPFIIEPEQGPKRIYHSGEMFRVGITLFGEAIQWFPFFILAFKEMGEQGIGNSRGHFIINSVTDQISMYQKEALYHHGDKTIRGEPKSNDVNNYFCDKKEDTEYNSVRIIIQTPIRLIHQRKLWDELSFRVLITTILRKLFLLISHYGNGDYTINHKELIELSNTITIDEEDTQWYDWTRYSTRQKARIQLGGIVGSITYCGNLTPFIPYLKIGEIIHIGKGATFGMGKYILEKVNACENQKTFQEDSPNIMKKSVLL